MGYDLSIRGEIPGEAEALAALEPQWREALAVRDSFPEEARGTRGEHEAPGAGVVGAWANADAGYIAAQRRVEELFEARAAANRSYFRLNSWGMASYRDTMELIGMGHWPETEPSWPEPASYGLELEQVWAAGASLEEPNEPETWERMNPEQRENAMRFHSDQSAVLSAHPGDQPGIALHKFCSNDGWQVTEQECREALELFGNWIARGYESGANTSMSAKQALATFCSGDQLEREIIINASAQRHELALERVGHPPLDPDEADERPTQLEILAEEYFLTWLQFLQDGARYGGFVVC